MANKYCLHLPQQARCGGLKKYRMDALEFHIPMTLLSPEVFEGIKNDARTVWGVTARRRSKSATTYRGDYYDKPLDEPTQCRVRPSSPTRVNKPHPNQIFLVTKLHTMPENYNTLKDKRAYKGKDGRWLYNDARPWTTEGERKNMMVQTEAQEPDSRNVTEAWMKLVKENECKTGQRVLGSSAKQKVTGHSYIDNIRCLVGLGQECRSDLLIVWSRGRH
ncbi:uncharacterized protein LOC106703400 isoform X2 [Latimeria chalumnae]|uniref:uncharacterized protein LOC106703400 isoform X2 n=1 Tax=Latimeria chalumnae TaxID=7897 RepID=UPI0006D8F7C3|nr:PREDICTED: uncharacterized protein LOC106703400 isoform X2 [Latimeria chalumnae]|eukprot:XP_014343655.1 PREDICTED: uncharacterized protein LOC106703400 isoform X2 [Latimeria chalumnae]